MRDAVRSALKGSPYVTSFEEAHENEGGAGVTVAKLGSTCAGVTNWALSNRGLRPA